jgi:hypothetical protein
MHCAECHFMLSAIYAECRKQAHYAECRCAECRSAQIRQYLSLPLREKRTIILAT